MLKKQSYAQMHSNCLAFSTLVSVSMSFSALRWVGGKGTDASEESSSAVRCQPHQRKRDAGGEGSRADRQSGRQEGDGQNTQERTQRM